MNYIHVWKWDCTCLIVASVVMETINQSVNKRPYLAVFGWRKLCAVVSLRFMMVKLYLAGKSMCWPLCVSALILSQPTDIQKKIKRPRVFGTVLLLIDHFYKLCMGWLAICIHIQWRQPLIFLCICNYKCQILKANGY